MGLQSVNSKFLTESSFAGREAWQGQAAGAGTRQTLLAWLSTLLGTADGPTRTRHVLRLGLLFGVSLWRAETLFCSLSSLDRGNTVRKIN